MDQLAVTKILDHIVDSLDIPESHYQKAAERHRSLGEWLCRTGIKRSEVLSACHSTRIVSVRNRGSPHRSGCRIRPG